MGLTGALSVAMYAIPVSLLTWGFEAEAERCARKTRAVIRQARSLANSTLEKVDSLNSDEEYLKIIAKDTSRSSAFDNDMKTEQIKRMTDLYMKHDHDGKRFTALTAFLSQGREGFPSPSPVAFDDKVYLSAETSCLQSRMEKLESSVISMHSKLDKLYAIVASQQDTSSIV